MDTQHQARMLDALAASYGVQQPYGVPAPQIPAVNPANAAYNPYPPYYQLSQFQRQAAAAVVAAQAQARLQAFGRYPPGMPPPPHGMAPASSPPGISDVYGAAPSGAGTASAATTASLYAEALGGRDPRDLFSSTSGAPHPVPHHHPASSANLYSHLVHPHPSLSHQQSPPHRESGNSHLSPHRQSPESPPSISSYSIGNASPSPDSKDSPSAPHDIVQQFGQIKIQKGNEKPGNPDGNKSDCGPDSTKDRREKKSNLFCPYR